GRCAVNIASSLVVQYVAAAQLSEWEPPAPHSWLSWREQREWDCFRSDERRRQWLAARWTAKNLVCRVMGRPLGPDVEILSRRSPRLGSRPVVIVEQDAVPLPLSISHTSAGVLVALARSAGMAVGVDLACGVPSSGGFQELWFAPAEQRWVERNPHVRAALVWGLKEAVYKAVNGGESFQPRLVEILVRPGRVTALYHGRPIGPMYVRMRRVAGGWGVVVGLDRVALAGLAFSDIAPHAPTGLALAGGAGVPAERFVGGMDRHG